MVHNSSFALSRLDGWMVNTLCLAKYLREWTLSGQLREPKSGAANQSTKSRLKIRMKFQLRHLKLTRSHLPSHPDNQFFSSNCIFSIIPQAEQPVCLQVNKVDEFMYLGK